MAIIRTYEPDLYHYTPTDQIQRQLSAELAGHVKAFLKKGGKIQKVSSGVSGEAFEFMNAFTKADAQKFRTELTKLGMPKDSKAEFFYCKKEGRFLATIGGNKIGTFTHPRLAMDALKAKAKLIREKRQKSIK